MLGHLTLDGHEPAARPRRQRSLLLSRGVTPRVRHFRSPFRSPPTRVSETPRGGAGQAALLCDSCRTRCRRVQSVYRRAVYRVAGHGTPRRRRCAVSCVADQGAYQWWYRVNVLAMVCGPGRARRDGGTLDGSPCHHAREPAQERMARCRPLRLRRHGRSPCRRGPTVRSRPRGTDVLARLLR